MEATIGRLIMSLPSADVYFCAPTTDDLTMPDRGKRISRATISDPIRVMRHLLQGLALLHYHHLIHGDITDSNVLIDTDGTPRFIDFFRPNKGRLSRYSTPEERAAGYSMTGPTIDCYRLGLVLRDTIGNSSVVEGLLHPNPACRWTASEALEHIHGL
jgi:serine/threonine protein kinase